MHERAHNEGLTEKRGDIITTRAVRVFSPKLGISGQCDVLEFHKSEGGIVLPDREGLWTPFPVEYKRGSFKKENFDRAQLCAQAMCLEEMLCCEISEGALYYGEIRRREKVFFTDDLRSEVKKALAEMHELYKRGYTPKVKANKSCKACSLVDICLPGMEKTGSVSDYLKEKAEEVL